MFLRPQDISICLEPSFTNDHGSSLTAVPAKINRLVHLGAEIQAELALADGQIITAHLTRENFDRLQLEPQQQVFVKPKEVKSFAIDYSI
jgi:sulfate/thiosulfate transport system ATP-binding protein